MDIISAIMLVLGGIGIIFGFLYGLKRGFTKALVRLLLIVVCAVVAFVQREQITEIVLNTPISEGKSIVQLLTEGMSSGEANMEGLANVITSVITMVLQIFVFILSFIILRIVTMIIYWIAAAIIKSVNKNKISKTISTDVESLANGRKLNKKQKEWISIIKENQNRLKTEEKLEKREVRRINNTIYKYEKKLTKKTLKRDRKPWLGGLVGLVQGALVAICVVSPLSGLVSDVGSLVESVSTIELDGSKILDDQTNAQIKELGLYDYPESTVAKVYDTVGGWLYKEISTVEGVDGNDTNIQAQIGAVQAGAQMVESVTKLTEVNFEEGLTENTVNTIVDIFNELDAIKAEMSPESVAALDSLIQEAITPMLGEMAEELPIDLSTISFAEVDFATEGQVVESFYDIYNTIESGEEIDDDQLLEDVVTTLSDSTLILPLVSQIVEELPAEEKPNFSESEKEQISDIIDNLENQENAEALKKLFGITE